MSNPWNRWTNTMPEIQPSDVLDLLVIDQKNNIVNTRQLADNLRWNDTGVIILAWRLVAKPKPKPDQLLATKYWNWRTSKWWPAAAKSPPRYPLPYFRIEFWQRPDGTVRLEYFLLEPPAVAYHYSHTEPAPEALTATKRARARAGYRKTPQPLSSSGQ